MRPPCSAVGTGFVHSPDMALMPVGRRLEYCPRRWMSRLFIFAERSRPEFHPNQPGGAEAWLALELSLMPVRELAPDQALMVTEALASVPELPQAYAWDSGSSLRGVFLCERSHRRDALPCCDYARAAFRIIPIFSHLDKRPSLFSQLAPILFFQFWTV